MSVRVSLNNSKLTHSLSEQRALCALLEWPARAPRPSAVRWDVSPRPLERARPAPGRGFHTVLTSRATCTSHATSHATRRLGSYTHTASRRKAEIGNCAENTTKSGLRLRPRMRRFAHTGSHVPTQIAHKVSGWQRSTGARYTKQSRGAYHTSRDSSRDMCSCEIDDEHPLPNGLVNQASQASKVQSPNIHRGRGRPASRRRSCLEHRQ